jgi:hypothetical protein
MFRPSLYLPIALLLFTIGGCEQTPSSEAHYRVVEMLKNKSYEKLLQEVTQKLEKEPKNRSLLEDRLILLLTDENFRQREALLETQHKLDEIGAGRNLLREQSKNQLSLVRLHTAYTLGALQDRGALGILKALAEDRDPDVRAEAIHALAKLNLPAAKYLLMIRLRDGYWKVRAEAADALGKLNDPTATKQLFRAVDDDDEYARMQILNAVLTLVSPSQEAIYLQEVNSPVPVKKIAAALALGKMQRQEAIPVLVELLKNRSAPNRLEMAHCLVKIAPDTVTNEIEKLLKGERNPQVKTVLADYLQQRRTPGKA